MPGAVLLAVGARTGSPDARRQVRAAAEAGAAAVVVKAHGEETDEPAAAAEAAGVALLAADDRVPWRHLDSLLTAAVGTTGDGTLPGVATGDLFALANAIAAAVGGAVAIEDPRQRVMAYSSLPDQPIDEVRQLGILGRQVPFDEAYPGLYRRVYGGTR